MAKTSAKDPPHFPINLGRRMRGPCGAHTFCGVIREFFFSDFKDMIGKGTITISGGLKNNLIQKLQKFRNIEFITKPECSWKWRRRRRRRRRRNRRRRISLLDDPPVLIMTPFLIIL
jgi:hypothetical protein